MRQLIEAHFRLYEGGYFMLSDSKFPSKDFDINAQLDETSHVVNHYVNQIKAQPDDFAHKHLKALQESIDRASNALLNYEFTKQHSPIQFDITLDNLDNAISFLSQKGEQEEIQATKDESHEELATEIVVALNSIQTLVNLLVNVRETTPIQGVDVKDESYKRGRKIKKATDGQFNDGKK